MNVRVKYEGVVDGMAQPRGQFPHFRRAGNFIFVSGISSRLPDGSIIGASVDQTGTVQLDLRSQTRAVIENIRDILKAAGADLRDLVELSVFLTNMDDFEQYNEIYNQYFDYSGPARTTVAVHELPHPHLLIEIKAIAYKET